MNSDALKALSDDELAQTEENSVEDYFRLRFQHHTGQLSNTAGMKQLRRTIARIKTLRTERAKTAANGE